MKNLIVLISCESTNSHPNIEAFSQNIFTFDFVAQSHYL